MKESKSVLKSLLFLAIFTTSCNKEVVKKSSELNIDDSQSIVEMQYLKTDNVKEVKYKGISGVIPAEYPSELFEYNPEKLSAIALNKYEKQIYKVRDIKGTTLLEIVESVYKRYPSFASFDANQYKRHFPNLTHEEILNNREEIIEFVEKIMAYEVVSAFSQLKDARFSLYSKPAKQNLRGSISPSEWLNTVCTVSVVLSHLRLDISGLQNSVDVANNLSSTHGIPTTNGGSHDRMDALRHGLWGVFLGKYGTWRYGDKERAKSIILELLFAHECGYSGMPVAMDVHNNFVALQYYDNHAIQTGPWWNRNTEIPQSDDDIVNEIKNYQVDLVSNETEINQRNFYTLVRFQ